MALEIAGGSGAHLCVSEEIGPLRSGNKKVQEVRGPSSARFRDERAGWNPDSAGIAQRQYTYLPGGSVRLYVGVELSRCRHRKKHYETHQNFQVTPQQFSCGVKPRDAT